MGQAQGLRLGVAMASSTICVSPTGVSLSPRTCSGFFKRGAFWLLFGVRTAGW